MVFNNFVQKYGLTNKSISIIKCRSILTSLSLSDVEISIRNGPFSRHVGTLNLHPSKGTHWNAYINENFFDSYGCSPPHKLSKIIIKRNSICLYSEYKIQGLNSKNDSHSSD